MQFRMFLCAMGLILLAAAAPPTSGLPGADYFYGAAGKRIIVHEAPARPHAAWPGKAKIYSLGPVGPFVQPTGGVLLVPATGQAAAAGNFLGQQGWNVRRIGPGQAIWLAAPREASMSAFALSRELVEKNFARWAEPDFHRLIKRHAAPNDPYLPRQWYLNNEGQEGALPGNDIGLFPAWEITRGDPEIRIAILDDGVDVGHPDLQDRIVAQKDFIDGDDDPTPVPGTGPHSEDTVGHGTACAGLAAATADNSEGIAGVCPACSIIAVRMLGRTASGEYLTDSTVAEAIGFAVDNGAAVISNSWGSDLGDPYLAGDEPAAIPAPAAIRTAVDLALREGRAGLGTVVVFAAGNANAGVDLDGIVSLPAAITVAAITDQGRRAYYSNYGDAIDVAAPSGGFGASFDGALIKGIWTTDERGAGGYNPGEDTKGDPAGNYYNRFAGTSASCPLVAGVAALALSANRGLGADQIRELIVKNADQVDPENGAYDENGHSQLYGYGRLNAHRVLLAATNQECVAVAETCDGRDNDCDGIIDEDGVCEGLAGFCEPCQTGTSCRELGSRCRFTADGNQYCLKPCAQELDCKPPAACAADDGGEKFCRPPSNDCARMAATGDFQICDACVGVENFCGESGVCLMDIAEKLTCAIACEPQTLRCPSGMSCFQVLNEDGTPFGDFCYPAGQDCTNGGIGGKDLCESCLDAVECGDGQHDTCVRRGDQAEGFCARDCAATACPSGYTCAEIAGQPGQPGLRQCLPATGACGGELPPVKCATGEICEPMAGAEGGVCMAPDLDPAAPPGGAGEIFGACAVDAPCQAGQCISFDDPGSGVCLNPCVPTPTAEEAPCAELQACYGQCPATDLACQQQCQEQFVNEACGQCLTAFNQCLTDTGCLGTDGSYTEECASQNCFAEEQACFGLSESQDEIEPCPAPAKCITLTGGVEVSICLPEEYPLSDAGQGQPGAACKPENHCALGRCVTIADVSPAPICAVRCDPDTAPPAGAAAKEGGGADDGCNCRLNSRAANPLLALVTLAGLVFWRRRKIGRGGRI